MSPSHPAQEERDRILELEKQWNWFCNGRPQVCPNQGAGLQAGLGSTFVSSCVCAHRHVGMEGDLLPGRQALWSASVGNNRDTCKSEASAGCPEASWKSCCIGRRALCVAGIFCFHFKAPFSHLLTEELCKGRGGEMAGWLLFPPVRWNLIFLFPDSPSWFFCFCLLHLSKTFPMIHHCLAIHLQRNTVDLPRQWLIWRMVDAGHWRPCISLFIWVTQWFVGTAILAHVVLV